MWTTSHPRVRRPSKYKGTPTQIERTMSTTAAELSNPLPSAKQAMEKLALAEAEKARDALRQKEKADADKTALIDQLSKPSGISEEGALKRAAAIIERAL